MRFKKQKLSLTILLASSMFLSGCAHLYKQNPKDPFEKYNRSMFNFNLKMEEYVVGPIVIGYSKVMPDFAKTGIQNFFSNIATIPSIANDILQANPKNLGNDTARLILNTTFGLGGLFDITKNTKLIKNNQRFRNTLYVWGWKDSAYFILPFLGPSTIRGTTSLVPNYYSNPLSYVKPWWLKDSLKGLKYLQIASVQLPRQAKIFKMAIDPYIAIRNAYMQNLKYRLDKSVHNKPKGESNPDETAAV